MRVLGLSSYPAPGVRHRDNCTLYNVGFYGFSYSSSVNGSSARFLNFNNGEIVLQSNNDRAGGRQVRCLQE